MAGDAVCRPKDKVSPVAWRPYHGRRKGCELCPNRAGSVVCCDPRRGDADRSVSRSRCVTV